MSSEHETSRIVVGVAVGVIPLWLVFKGMTWSEVFDMLRSLFCKWIAGNHPRDHQASEFKAKCLALIDEVAHSFLMP
jgi:hypothetical protein